MILTAMMAAALAPQTETARSPQRARANLNQYFSADDYPQTALMSRAEGTTSFRLEIDAEGNITRCSVIRSSGNAALDATTCSVLLGRARYQPARDSRGRAVAGKDEGRVTWRLPPPPGPPPLVPVRTVSRLHGDGNGLLVCTVLVNGVAMRDVGTSQCGALAGTGVDYALRSATAPADVVMIWATGPDSAGIDTPAPDEAALGTRGFDLVAAMDIGPDGRGTSCQIVRRETLPSLTLLTPPDLCARNLADAPPMFEATTETAPRRARGRLTLYLSGWALDALSGNAPPPGPPRP
jgi:TonB family protein